MKSFKDVLDNPDYKDFILSHFPCLLGISGSYAYGTNVEGSDIDIRGCCPPTASQIYGFGDKNKVYKDLKSDTVIYSFHRFITLCAKCNPNVIELLGLKPEHYIYLDGLGKDILEMKPMFLSKHGIHNTFLGYTFGEETRLKKGTLDFSHMNKAGMHMVRLLKFGAEILRKGEINTYREVDHNLLMDIRNGVYTDRYGILDERFWKMVEDSRKDFLKAEEESTLPDNVDMGLIESRVIGIMLHRSGKQ